MTGALRVCVYMCSAEGMPRLSYHSHICLLHPLALHQDRLEPNTGCPQTQSQNLGMTTTVFACTKRRWEKKNNQNMTKTIDNDMSIFHVITQGHLDRQSSNLVLICHSTQNPFVRQTHYILCNMRNISTKYIQTKWLLSLHLTFAASSY